MTLTGQNGDKQVFDRLKIIYVKPLGSIQSSKGFSIFKAGFSFFFFRTLSLSLERGLSMIRLLFENLPAFSNLNIEEIAMVFLKDRKNISIDTENIDQSTMKDLLSIAKLAKSFVRNLRSNISGRLGAAISNEQTDTLKRLYREGYRITYAPIPFTIDMDREEKFPISSQIIPLLENVLSSLKSSYPSIKVSLQSVERYPDYIHLLFRGSLGTVKGIPIIHNGQKQSKDIRVDFDIDGVVRWSLPECENERELSYYEDDYDYEEPEVEDDEDDYEGPYYEYEGPGEAEYYFKKGERLGEQVLSEEIDESIPIERKCKLSLQVMFWSELI